jgi:hypothetical protein
MSGYYDNVKYDLCSRQYESALNDAQSDHTFDVKAWTRATDVAPSLGAGISPDFYGAKRGNRVTQESFMQGRGHTLSDCADCGVIQLPAGVFPNNGKMRAPACERTDLQGEYTKLPRSCNGLTELDTTGYTMFPMHFQTGFLGYDAVVDTVIQTRINAASCDMGRYE